MRGFRTGGLELKVSRVLIVEDNPDICEMLRYNIERFGIDARVAETGEIGLIYALDPDEKPDLIILDVMLPGMNGIDVCRRLRREDRTRETPIIMLTAKGSEADRIKGLASGANEYIVKPFSIREMMERIRAMI